METTTESQKAIDNSGDDIVDGGPLANALLLHIREYYPQGKYNATETVKQAEIENDR